MDRQQQPLVLYHNDNDGFCAAWVYRYWVNSQAEFKVGRRNMTLPSIYGRQVILLDFTLSRSALENIAHHATSVTVLDHHASAQRTVGDLPYCHIDVNKSTARLAWEHFVEGDREAPWIVRYVEDRDLWQFKLDQSRDINAALESYPRNFEQWDDLYDRGTEDLFYEGQAILRYQRKIIDCHSRHYTVTSIGNYEVPVVCASMLQSEIAHDLNANWPFSATFFTNENGHFVYSLRSRRGSDIDLSDIAGHYGGGGHRHAAAFVSKTLLPMNRPR